MTPTYEGQTRECSGCGHVTNVHADCDACQTHICENCERRGAAGRYCSEECEQECCEHSNLHYEQFDDVSDEYVNYWEIWTCKDCGAQIDHDGDVITSDPLRRKNRKSTRRAA